MRLRLVLLVVLTLTAPLSAQLENVSGMLVRGNLSNTFVRYDLRPVFMPSQNGELVESASRCGRK